MSDFYNLIIAIITGIGTLIALILAWRSNKKADESNKISKESNRIAEESKEIAKKALSSKALEIHSNDLKEFLDDWATGFPMVSSDYTLKRNTTPFPEKQPEQFIEEIEKNDFYSDFMENHVPSKEFKQAWEEYKNMLDTYYEKKDELFLKLKEDIEKETGLPCSEDYKEHHVMEYFLDPIYESYVQRARNEYVDTNAEPQEEKNSNKTTIDLRDIRTGAVIANGSQNEIKKAKMVFKNHINSSDYFNQFRKQVEEIIEIKNKIDVMATEIIADLERYKKRAIYSEPCEFNKNKI